MGVEQCPFGELDQHHVRQAVSVYPRLVVLFELVLFCFAEPCVPVEDD